MNRRWDNYDRFTNANDDRPDMDVEATCPACGEDDYIAYNGTHVSDDDPPKYTHEFQCDKCGCVFQERE